jgi:hypothetical protein
MISDIESLESFRQRYSYLHPLVVQRSIERAVNLADLFEILESVPKKPPFSWNEEKHAWIKNLDVSGKNKFKEMLR